MNRKRAKARTGQLELSLGPAAKRGRGGVRPGAGRKPGAGRRLVRHREREAHQARHPVHVVLRSRYRPLRSQHVFPTLRIALTRATRARGDFRITQFSVQGDHLHLIVEAASPVALSRGMQGLAVRIARSVNRLVNRAGVFWADRFFSRELRSPRVVRHALSYVLNNFRKHDPRAAAAIDPYSSAPYFRGFYGLHGRAPREFNSDVFATKPWGLAPLAPDEPLPIVPAQTWLGHNGWQRGGPIVIPKSSGGR